MSSAVIGNNGGQPSTTQPIATPWLSPKVVTRNRWPKVLWDMVCRNAQTPLGQIAKRFEFGFNYTSPTRGRGTRKPCPARSGDPRRFQEFRRPTPPLAPAGCRHGRPLPCRREFIDTSRPPWPATKHSSRRPAATLSIFRPGAGRTGRGPGLHLRKRRAFPFPITDFAQAIVDGVCLQRKSQDAAHQFHRLTGAPERTGDKANRRRVRPSRAEQISEDMAGMNRLLAAELIERNVLCALEPALRVPLGLAVTNVIDGRHLMRSRVVMSAGLASNPVTSTLRELIDRAAG